MSEHKLTPYDLDVNSAIKDVLIDKKHIPEFWPPQASVLADSDILTGVNTVVYMQTAAGKCVHPDTPILLSSGELLTAKNLFDKIYNNYRDKAQNTENETIINVRNGINLFSLNRSTLKIDSKPVTSFYRQYIKENLIEVVTESGRKITTTKIHPFLTINSGKIGYTRAGILTSNTYIGVSRKISYLDIDTNQKIEYDKEIVDNGNINIKISDEINTILRELVNKFGNIKNLALNMDLSLCTISNILNKNNETIRPETYNKICQFSLEYLDKEPKKEYYQYKQKISKKHPIPKEVTDDLIIWLAMIFSEGNIKKYGSGYNITFTQNDLKYHEIFRECTQKLFNYIPTTKKDKNTYTSIIYSKYIHDFLKSLGATLGRSEKKSIPKFLLKLSDKQIALFLKYYISKFDGYIDNKGIEITLTSDQNINLFGYLFTRFGIPFTISNKYINGKNYPRIFISKSGRKNYESIIDQEISKTEITTTLKHDTIPDIYNILQQNSKIANVRAIDREIKSFVSYYYGQRPINRSILNKIADYINDEYLKKLANSDITWEKVISISEIPYEGFVYDFTIDDSHNFVSGYNGGIITHNTLIAEIAAMEAILESDKKIKVVYTTPLKALASEKLADFIKDWGDKVSIVMMSGDVGGRGLADDIRRGNEAQIIITTNEKLDSLIRHNVPWLRKVSVLVVDEIHNIISENRGPTIEVVVAKLRQLRGNELQIIGLSATLGNAKQLAEWLDADLYPMGTYTKERVIVDPITKKKKTLTKELPLSEWRPVELRKGIYDAMEGTITWIDKIFEIEVTIPIEQLLYKEKPVSTTDYKHNAIVSLTVQGILPSKEGEETKQVLVFTATRGSAESTALMLAGKETARKKTGYIYPLLKGTEKRDAETLAKEMLKGYAPSTGDEELAEMIKRGAGYHHAGLRAKQRGLTESGFRDKIIKVICATPTLAAGVNLPAKRVILSTHQRWGGEGYVDLPVYEVNQMLGRAGRPNYDRIGDAILIATNPTVYSILREKYIYGDVEDIESHLGEEHHLRKHLLSYISARREKIKEEVKKIEWVPRADIEDFILNTFFGYQAQSVVNIQPILDTVFKFYIENDLAQYDKPSDSFLITKFGKRTVELYIDPLSAVMIKKGLDIIAKYGEGIKTRYTNISWLNLLAYCPDIELVNQVGDSRPDRDLIFGFTTRELEKHRFYSVNEKRDITETDNPIPPEPLYWKFEDYSLRMQEFLKAMKLTIIMAQWINEVSDDKIQEIFKSGKVSPGDTFRYKEIYDWLLYASSEIATLFKYSKRAASFTKLRLRIQSGIREDILELVSLKGVGRVLGRRIFNYLLAKTKISKKELTPIVLQELNKLSEEELHEEIKGIGPERAKLIKEQLETGIRKKVVPKTFEKE